MPVSLCLDYARDDAAHGDGHDGGADDRVVATGDHT